jgi:hypothetical protein
MRDARIARKEVYYQSSPSALLTMSYYRALAAKTQESPAKTILQSSENKKEYSNVKDILICLANFRNYVQGYE